MWSELLNQRDEWEGRWTAARSRSVSQTTIKGLDLFLLNGRPLEGFNPRHNLKGPEQAFKRRCWDRHLLDHRMSNSWVYSKEAFCRLQYSRYYFKKLSLSLILVTIQFPPFSMTWGKFKTSLQFFFSNYILLCSIHFFFLKFYLIGNIFIMSKRTQTEIYILRKFSPTSVSTQVNIHHASYTLPLTFISWVFLVSIYVSINIYCYFPSLPPSPKGLCVCVCVYFFSSGFLYLIKSRDFSLLAHGELSHSLSVGSVFTG